LTILKTLLWFVFFSYKELPKTILDFKFTIYLNAGSLEINLSGHALKGRGVWIGGVFGKSQTTT
jgi:hypothetical protein